MLDRHAIQELLRAKVPARQIAQQLKVSVRTVRRIGCEGTVDSGDDVGSRAGRGIGRRGVSDAVRSRVTALLKDDPELPPGEVWRLLREEGAPLGLSTVYRVLVGVRATLPTALMVRFEGVAGEFAQFDFGEVSLRLTDDSRRTVHFAAYRLKYSRWVHVVLVPNERVEALIRALLASLSPRAMACLCVSCSITRRRWCSGTRRDGPSGMRRSRRWRSSIRSRWSSVRPVSRNRRARTHTAPPWVPEAGIVDAAW